MRRKFLFLLSITIFISSIMSNIYLCHVLWKNKITATQSDNKIVTATPLNPEVTHEEASNYFEDNPVDQFFNAHELASYSNMSMGKMAFVYRELWKVEMNNAYQALIHAAHNDIKGSIMKSQKLIIDYAESEASISCAVGGSNAFGNEDGKMPEKVSYGTIRSVLWNDTIGQIYKNRTKELLKYCQDIGLEIRFLFTQKSLEKYDVPGFLKKEK